MRFQQYLTKLASGSWTGTMCLTEPHCGTDLGQNKTKAVRQADGTFKITGTKIFISAGDHDMAENIVRVHVCTLSLCVCVCVFVYVCFFVFVLVCVV